MDIYRITDKSTGLTYIGRTNRDVRFRISEHKYKQSLIEKAILEKGIDNFEIEIIDHADSYSEGRALEKKWIEHYNCFYPNGYNLADGDSRYGSVNGFFGKKHSAKTVASNIKNQKSRKAVRDCVSDRVYPGIRFCARMLGLTKTHVSRLCRGLCPKSQYHLEFIKE